MMQNVRHWAATGLLLLSGGLLSAAEPTPAVQTQLAMPPMAPPSPALPPPLPFSPPPPGVGPALPPGAPMLPPPGLPPRRPRLIRDYSWIQIEMAEPRTIKVHDIITVIVDEKSEVTENARYNRQKNGIFKAELKNFIRINSEGNLDTAAEEQPTIEGRLQSTMNSRGELQSREGIRYRIAATVVDVLPNGTIILEARKTIRTNNDIWEYSLTGRIRSEDILANNTVLSENIADLDIKKSERGQVRDATKRGIFLAIYDFFLPI